MFLVPNIDQMYKEMKRLLLNSESNTETETNSQILLIYVQKYISIKSEKLAWKYRFVYIID